MTRSSSANDSARICSSACFAPLAWPQERREAQPRPLVLAFETFGGREFERNAGQMLGRLAPGDPLLADGRVVQHDAALASPTSARRNDSCPSEGSPGSLQLSQMLRLEANRPRREVQVPGDLDHGSQRDAVERDRMLPAERVQVDAMAVVARHHGEARQAAFGRFRLHDDGQRAPATEIQHEPLRSLHPHVQNGVQEPAHELAPLEQNVGAKQHAGLERNLLTVGVDVGPIERGDDLVGRFAAVASATAVSASDRIVFDTLSTWPE